MSTPNPLAPQGSLLEQQAKSRSSLQIGALIVGLHVFVLGGFLILGCSKEVKKDEAKPLTDSLSNPSPITGDTNLPSLDAGAIAALPGGLGASTSVPPAVLGAVTTNPPVVESPAPAVANAPANAGSAAAAGEYKIQKGDIAYNVAKKNGVSLKALKEANANVDLGKLKVGQTIQIPAGAAAPAPAPAQSAKTEHAGAAADTASSATGETVSYTVKGGDSITKIAKKFGTSVKAVRAANGLKGNEIKVGQKLKVPAKAAAPAAEPAAAPAAAPAIPTASPAQPPR